MKTAAARNRNRLRAAALFWGRGEKEKLLAESVALGSGDGGDEQFADFTAFCKHIPVFVLGNHMGILEQAKPIVGFVAFFQRDLKFIDKIRLARGIIGFVDICADTCTASQYLV
jgi:hypothetical protein